MKLNEFSDFLSCDKLNQNFDEVSGISFDSRSVQPGNLFFALSGEKVDGALYLEEAEKKGALALIVGLYTKSEKSHTIPVIQVENVRRTLALCCSRFYPKQPKTMVAVTGTSGKTSVVSFLRQIWEQAGYCAASIGTTGVTGPNSVSSCVSLTTPDPLTLHKILQNFVASDITHAAMEASSHGLHQARLDGVSLFAGAFTNLKHDHLDYHGTIEDYLSAKLKLFQNLLKKGSPAVIFSDDSFSDRVIDVARNKHLDVLTIGRKGSFIQLKRVEHERFRQRAEVFFNNHIYEIVLPLAGSFQIYNALVAAGLAIASGVCEKKVFEALENLKGASGRLEYIGANAQGAPVYVDYAHKPDALENVLSSLRPFTTGRLIIVFGCGGDRDRLKRPIMGEIAKRLADVCIVTDDNPRFEDPQSIRSAILSAVPRALEIADRREAIQKAVSMLQKGDTLVIAGKGHEEGQIFRDVIFPFSDHEEVRKALKEFQS